MIKCLLKSPVRLQVLGQCGHLRFFSAALIKNWWVEISLLEKILILATVPAGVQYLTTSFNLVESRDFCHVQWNIYFAIILDKIWIFASRPYV